MNGEVVSECFILTVLVSLLLATNSAINSAITRVCLVAHWCL